MYIFIFIFLYKCKAINKKKVFVIKTESFILFNNINLYKQFKILNKSCLTLK